jgi:hypothetical protein
MTTRNYAIIDLIGFCCETMSSLLLRTTLCERAAKIGRKQSAKISRTFRRFHAHALIAKLPRTRRWRLTVYGRQVMATSLYLREHHFPNAYAKIAA